VKFWFCENEARGTCAACGRALCWQHAHVHDKMTITNGTYAVEYPPPLTNE